MTMTNRRVSGVYQNVLMGAIIGAALGIALPLIVKSGGRGIVAKPDEPIVAAYDMVEIPVPAQPVNAGTRVADIPFRRVSYPRHQVPEGALVDVSLLRDSFAIAPLPANMPLFEPNFALRPIGTNPVVERIPKGMRAITVRVDATSSVEGWAGSGSLVDVLLIGHDRTSVIAEQVRVLSAERVVMPIDGSSAPHVPSTATLLVTQDQCLAINTAIPLGKIAFALRSPDDRSMWQRSQFTAELLRNRPSDAHSEREGIKGLLTINDQGGAKTYALSGNRWIATDIVPEGFRLHPSAGAL